MRSWESAVVIAAMIDEKHGEIYSTTISLPSMEGSQILDSLKEAFPDYPVDLLNDTACYSYAEKIYGGITEKNFAFINFGNRGIGASLFVDGSMLGKANGSFYPVRPLFCGPRRAFMRLRKPWLPGGSHRGAQA